MKKKSNKKLRIGILIDSLNLKAWEYELIRQINLSDHSEICLIVRSIRPAKIKTSFSSYWKNRKNLFFILYSKIERKLFRPTPNAFTEKKLTDLLFCEEIVVEPIETKFSDRLKEEDIKKIKAQNLDVLLRIGFRILRGEILNSAKYGVWSYHHGDNKVNRGGPAGVWEVLEGWNETGVVLQILTEDLDGGQVLYSSHSSTDSISYIRNKNNYYWKAVSFVPRILRRLHTMGEKEFFEDVRSKNLMPYFYYNRLYITPLNYEVFRNLLKKYFRYIKNRITGVFYFDQWILLFRIEKEPGISKSFFRFKRIIPPKDRFWADPFVIKKENNYYIYLEEFLYQEKKGKISLMIMDAKGNYNTPQVVLEKDYHLSYPFLIEDHGNLYMIPETFMSGRIELYECESFPDQWNLKTILIDNINAVDATVLKYNNKYWLFCNVQERKGASTYDELFLFYSDSLTSKNWQEHPLNPVVSDVKGARPAGKVFTHNDKLFRPAQNCTLRYGYGMQIKHITKLSESEYDEILVQSINPNWANDLRATHTLNSVDKLTLIDAQVRRSKI